MGWFKDLRNEFNEVKAAGQAAEAKAKKSKQGKSKSEPKGSSTGDDYTLIGGVIYPKDYAPGYTNKD